ATSHQPNAPLAQPPPFRASDTHSPTSPYSPSSQTSPSPPLAAHRFPRPVPPAPQRAPLPTRHPTPTPPAIPPRPPRTRPSPKAIPSATGSATRTARQETGIRPLKRHTDVGVQRRRPAGQAVAADLVVDVLHARPAAEHKPLANQP